MDKPVDQSGRSTADPRVGEGAGIEAVKELCIQAFDIYKEKQLARQHYTVAEIQAAAVNADRMLDRLVLVAQAGTEPRPNHEHERVLLLTNIRTSAAAGLTYGTGPTPHTPERIIERKNKALRDILTFLERDGIVGSVLRSITEDEIGSAPDSLREASASPGRSESAKKELDHAETEPRPIGVVPPSQDLSLVFERDDVRAAFFGHCCRSHHGTDSIPDCSYCNQLLVVLATAILEWKGICDTEPQVGRAPDASS